MRVHIFLTAVFFLVLNTDMATAQEPLVILTLGDSITSGFHGSLDSAGVYRQEIQRSLLSDNIAHDFVGDRLDFIGNRDNGMGGLYDGDHGGAPGEGVGGITARAGGLSSQYRPDFVLILAGTNNHFADPFTTDFVALYEALIGEVLNASPDSNIIFSTVPKFGPGLSFAEQRNTVTFPAINSAIHTAASDNDNVSVVDLFSVFDVNTDLAFDSVHLNLTGHQRLGALFDDEIRNIAGFGTAGATSVPEPGTGTLIFAATAITALQRPRRSI